jgi:hypothetical protein
MMNETGKKITNMNIKFPKLVFADDYHEFSSDGAMARLLQDLDPRLKLKEVGFLDTMYMGVVYEGRMPNRAEILEMIKDRFGKKDLSTLEVRIGDKEYDSKKDKWVTAW